jgi:putative peptidoglycan lipid II flippase
VLLAGASVVGSFLQFAVQLPFVFRHSRNLRFGLDVNLAPVRRVFANFAPVVLSRGVVQLSAYIDGMVASFLGASAVASMAYAQTIYMLPVSLFGMAVAAAELPEMSTRAGNTSEAQARLNARVKAGRRQITFFVVPSMTVFILLGRYVVSALYQTGKFGPDDTLYVWILLTGSAVSLLAATWGRLFSSAFYALGDTRTPMRVAFLRLIVSVSTGLLLAFVLRPIWVGWLLSIPGFRLPAINGIETAIGAVGLTFATGAGGWLECLLLQRFLQSRVGSLHMSLKFLGKVWASALAAAAAALMASPYIHDWRVLRYDFAPVAVLAIFGGVYLTLAMAFRLEEGQRFFRRLRRA